MKKSKKSLKAISPLPSDQDVALLFSTKKDKENSKNLFDAPIFLGFIYCCEMPKNNSKEIMFFNDIFKKMTKLNFPIPRYDIIFHLNPDLKPINDGIRPELHFDEQWRQSANQMIITTMSIFKPKLFYSITHKDLESRTKLCLEKISEIMQIKEK